MGKTSKCKFTLPFPMPKCVQCLRIYCWRVCGCWRWRGNCANCVPTWRPPGVVMLQPAAQQPTPSWPEQVPRHRHPEQGSCSHPPAGGMTFTIPWSCRWCSSTFTYLTYLTLPSYLYPDLTHFSQRQMTKINPTCMDTALSFCFRFWQWILWICYDSIRFIRYLLLKL